MRRPFTRVTLLVLALLVVSACGEQITPPETVESPSVAGLQVALVSLTPGMESPVIVHPAWQRFPDIDGDLVVWSDDRAKGSGYGRWDTYYLDLTAPFETLITPAPDWDTQGYAKVSGDRIVWMDSRNGNYDIYMFDTSTGVETQITTGPEADVYPAISGDIVVWEQGWGSGQNIWYHNLATGQSQQVTFDPAEQRQADVDGDRIVWMDKRGGANRHIYMYDISTGVETQLSFAWQGQGEPAISGDRVVWSDQQCYCTYVMDLTTNRQWAVSPQGGWQTSPDIDGDLVVFADDRNGNGDIYLNDLSTGAERQITTDPANQFEPAVSGNRVVWVDARNGDQDIYIYVVPPNNHPPVAMAGADRTVVRTSPAGVTVTLDGTQSFDSDGGIVLYEWFEGGAQLASGPTAAVELALGAHEITLRVTDDFGDTDEDQVVIIVINLAPTAVAVTPEPELITVPMNFDGSGSYDIDGTLTYAWDFGDGAQAAGPIVTHAYAVAGAYSVTFTVTDNDGGFNTLTLVATALTPAEATQVIVDDIDQLVADGVVDENAIKGARTQASQAKILLDGGQDSAAEGKLRDFIKRVESMIRSGKISQQEGDALIAGATDVSEVILLP